MSAAIDGDRLWRDLMGLAEFTDPDRPYSRTPCSPLHVEARAWLRNRFQEAGLIVKTDAAGNLIGRLAGSEDSLPPIMMGSHSDTVPHGGRFDGAAGVIAALEVARAINESGVPLTRALEVVDFLAEEPNDYGVSRIGSRGMVGQLGADHLRYQNGQGETVAMAVSRMGGDPADLETPLRRAGDVAAFLELHIEQGPVLEARGRSIGVVTDIIGIRRATLEFTGQANHAGTTPMDLRRDALVAAAELMLDIEARARATSSDDCYFVATVGRMEVAPNGANVVPQRATLTLDARSTRDAQVVAFFEAIDAAGRRIAEARDLGWRMAPLTETPTVVCDARLQAIIERVCAERGVSRMHMPSGAGHDAATMAEIAPAAMIFVPSRDGISHASVEWTEPDQLTCGAEVLLGTVLRLDQDAQALQAREMAGETT